MKRTVLVLCMLGLFLVGGRRAAYCWDYDWKVLDAGKVQTAIEQFQSSTEKGVKKRAVAAVIMNATADEVWVIQSDWDAMKAYVPNLKYYRTVFLSDTDKYIAGRLRILGMNIDYPLHVWFDHKKYNHTWVMLKDEELPALEKKGIKGLNKAHFAIKNIEGFFEILDAPNRPGKSLFVYKLIIETTIPVPDAVEAYLSKLTLPGYVAAVKKRVEDYRAQTQKNQPAAPAQ